MDDRDYTLDRKPAADLAVGDVLFQPFGEPLTITEILEPNAWGQIVIVFDNGVTDNYPPTLNHDGSPYMVDIIVKEEA